MRNLFFSFLAILLVASACQNSSSNVTESGYKYEHYVKNDGPKPQPGEFVNFHVQMRNGQDSIVFKSREQSQVPKMQIPETAAEPNDKRQPSPLVEAFKLMSVGDSLSLYYPIDTIQAKPRNFEKSDFVIYDLVMTKILTKEDYQKEQEAERAKMESQRQALQAREGEVSETVKEIAKKYAAGTLGDEMKSLDSGLKYIMLEEGTGKQAAPQRNVKVNYYGILPNGEMFDNSFTRGTPFPFPLGAGRVIRGWDEGIALFKEGGKGVLIIPSELGYGAAGSPPKIPENSELLFYVELEEVM